MIHPRHLVMQPSFSKLKCMMVLAVLQQIHKQPSGALPCELREFRSELQPTVEDFFVRLIRTSHMAQFSFPNFHCCIDLMAHHMSVLLGPFSKQFCGQLALPAW